MRTVLVGFLALLAAVPAAAETVTIEASGDATLIEDTSGALANGSGPYFFVGRTASRDRAVRRAVLRFDVAAAVPARAIIESVSLTVYLWPSHPEPRAIELHRVQQDWGEGPSFSSGGGGAPAQAGDVTWIHASYDTDPWVRPGAQFVARSSAVIVMADYGPYTFPSTNHLVQDVRLWVSNPGRNFGWVMIGDEIEPQSVKSFASREHPDLNLRPTLTVTFREPGR